VARPLVTVKTLITQSRERGEVELPADALITPAAADWLRGSRIPVRRVKAGNVRPEPAPGNYLIGDAADPYLQALLPTLERTQPGLEFLPCNGDRRGLLNAVQRMCGGIAESPGRSGVVVVANGAIPDCVANKHAHVRAAIAAGPSVLLVLQRELGLNVLIIERDRTSVQQARGMIETFFRGPTQLDPVIEAAIAGSSAPASAAESAACGCGV
jgi:hypothetical protein